LIYLDGGFDDLQAEQPVAKPGTVVVSVSPPAGIEVLVDGKNVATSSPATIEELAVGPHSVRVTAEGYKPFETTVDVASDGLIPLEVSLEPSTPAMGRVAAVLPGISDEAQKSLEVYLDGEQKSVDEAQEGWTLAAGTHLVEVRAKGFKPFSLFVELERDGDEKIEITLVPSESKLSFPEDATIRVDGKRRKGPIVSFKPNKVHNLKVSGPYDWEGAIGFPTLGMGKFDPEAAEAGATEDDFGWLTLNTGKSWWVVVVDGNETGLTTPLTGDAKLPIRAGKRTITLRRGFATRDIPVDVRKGETVVVRQKLEFIFDGGDGS
jgi:hypothetical protein